MSLSCHSGKGVKKTLTLRHNDRSVILILTITIGLIMGKGPMVLAQSSQLDQYIKIGLENNLDLSQSKLSLEQSHKALDEARAGFLPSLDFSSRYTRATGGRSFEIPTGDLMNPVYSALNNITGENSFPMIENQVLNFNREIDIDTRLSLTQPLFDRRLSFQRDIAKQQVKSAYEAVNTHKRMLVADIKKSYFNYLKMVKIVDLLKSTQELALENLRVSQSLFENDKVTQDAVLRSKSDLSDIKFQLADAEKNLQVARAYFNYLLNIPLESPIEVDDIHSELPETLSIATNPKLREEWKQLEHGRQAVMLQTKLSRAQNIPNIYAAVDYGFQGTTYEFNSRSDYSLASLVLSWNLFSGGKHKAERQRIVLESRKLESQQKSLEQAIELEVIQAYYAFQAASKNRLTAINREKEATETYRLIHRKFKEDLASQVALMDARNTLTSASLQKIIAHYDAWSALAEYERATATYSFEN
ncbi:TolC family protein [Fulvivirgaceae bacterium BMA10]|uniref:TolC family protein n=1 Tax=Splendidivirga corallicola TaxID=3051826 RepID=A0ABT8KIB9_9BACT|nr:TolC family protein [Fulvivirgaceae bacterium BMA10]